MQKTCALSEQELLESFVDAFKTVDFQKLEEILSDTGEFDVQDDALETIASDRSTFLHWIKPRLKQTPIVSVDYDQCLFCDIGCPVVLFNKGEFPRRARSFGENSTTGLRVGIENGTIKRIQFCNNLTNTKTQFEYERVGHKISELTKTGMSFHEAYAQVTGKPTENHVQDNFNFNTANSNRPSISTRLNPLGDSGKLDDLDDDEP